MVKNVEGDKYTFKTVDKLWCASGNKRSVIADREAPQSWEHWTIAHVKGGLHTIVSDHGWVCLLSNKMVFIFNFIYLIIFNCHVNLIILI